MGNRTKVKVVKNKVAPPFTEAEFDVLFARGIYWSGSILDCAMQHGLIEKKGSWLSFEGMQLGQGREASAECLEKDPALQEKMVQILKEKVRAAAGKGAATAAVPEAD